MAAKSERQNKRQKETLNQYRQVIEKVLTEYASIPYALGEIEIETVFDRERDRYLVVDVGWDKDGRVHGCLIHLDIIEGKIWIQRDGSEDGIATDLEREGIPKEHIVLGFKPPSIRPFTDYAAA